MAGFLLEPEILPDTVAGSGLAAARKTAGTVRHDSERSNLQGPCRRSFSFRRVKQIIVAL
jgi:hypothetical protein